MGEIYLYVGRLEEAARYTEEALAFARAHHKRGREAWSLRLLGEIIVRRDALALDHAVSYYAQALALANELDMRPLQAQCHHGLGTLYCRMAHTAQARDELYTAIEMYQEMEMTFWLPQAEAMLAEMEGRG